MIDLERSVEPKSTMTNSRSQYVWFRMLSIASPTNRSISQTTIATETVGESILKTLLRVLTTQCHAWPATIIVQQTQAVGDALDGAAGDDGASRKGRRC